MANRYKPKPKEVAKGYANEQMMPFAIHPTYITLRPATIDEQKFQKFDWLVRNISLNEPENMEGKDEKRACRFDKEIDPDNMPIEFRNVSGGDGWVKFSGPVLQRRGDKFISYDRNKLKEFVEKEAINYPHTPTPKKACDRCEIKRFYQRENRRDVFIYMPFVDLDFLVQNIFIIPTYALELEKRYMEEVKIVKWPYEVEYFEEALELVEGLWIKTFTFNTLEILSRFFVSS